MWTELALLVCAAVALSAAKIGKPPPPVLRRAYDRTRAPRTDEPERPPLVARGSRESRVAWCGFGCAAIAAVGHLVFPAANLLWVALLAIAILSLPAAAALSLGGRSRKDDNR